MDVMLGCGEELAVALEECAPTIAVPRELFIKALEALESDLHLRSIDVQQMVSELQQFLK